MGDDLPEGTGSLLLRHIDGSTRLLHRPGGAVDARRALSGHTWEHGERVKVRQGHANQRAAPQGPGTAHA